MPGSLRERGEHYGDHTGFIYPAGDPSNVTPSSVSKGSAVCKDVVGNFGRVNVFDLERWRLSPGYFTGIEAVWPVYGFTNYPYTNQPSPDFASADWDAGKLGDVEAVTKVASWSNPVKSHVDITTMIYELRELPELVKKYWDLTVRAAKKTPPKRGSKDLNTGNSVLDLNWGIAPLISDTIKLFQFTKAFDKRARDLAAIYDRPHGLKRQRVLWSNSVEDVRYVAANSFVCGIGVNRHYKTMSRQWAAVTWKPWFDFQSRPSDTEIANKAILALNGIKNPWAIAYEILPWSWLIDYFSNVGDLVELTGNAFEYKIDQSCVMSSSTTLITDEVVVQSPDFIVTPAVGHYELKFRVPASIGFSVNSSVISTQQQVNLLGVASNWKSKH